METPNAPHGETTLIGQSIVIKGELSCGEDLFIDGQVEGAIDQKGNRLTIGPKGHVNANIRAAWSCKVSWRAAFKPVTGLT